MREAGMAKVKFLKRDEIESAVLCLLRARAKITSHFGRRCIPPGCVAKTRNIGNIPAFSRLAGRAPTRPNL
jgi:hypothetical protein